MTSQDELSSAFEDMIVKNMHGPKTKIDSFDDGTIETSVIAKHKYSVVMKCSPDGEITMTCAYPDGKHVTFHSGSEAGSASLSHSITTPTDQAEKPRKAAPVSQGFQYVFGNAPIVPKDIPAMQGRTISLADVRNETTEDAIVIIGITMREFDSVSKQNIQAQRPNLVALKVITNNGEMKTAVRQFFVNQKILFIYGNNEVGKRDKTTFIIYPQPTLGM